MKAQELVGDFFVAVTIPRSSTNLDLVSPLEPEFVLVHARFCADFDSRLNEWIDMIKDAGAKPAASTDPITVGITSEEEMEETYSAALGCE